MNANDPTAASPKLTSNPASNPAQLQAKPRAQYLEGALSVRAAIEAGRREVYVMYLEQGRSDRESRKVKQAAEKAGVTLKRRTRQQLDQMAQGSTHGGVMAACGELPTVKLDQLMQTPDTGPVVMLEGVEDPYNFGYAVRALYAAGCRGLIVRNRNWAQTPQSAAVVARASAGALEHLPMATVEHPDEAVAWAKGQGLRVWAAESAEDAKPIDQADLAEPSLILIGGEKRGLPKKTLSLVDGCLVVPYGRSFDAALSSVAAAAVIGFEASRQKRQSHGDS